MNFQSFIHVSKVIQATVLLAVAVTLAGCTRPMPEIVPVTGTVTIDGQPYENVGVRFIPLAKGMDGNTTASATTDREGKYTLEIPGTGPGAYAFDYAVIIQEGDLPAKVRESRNDQIAVTQFMDSLKNRPIPKRYRLMNDTPLKITVTPEQTVYDLKLKR